MSLKQIRDLFAFAIDGRQELHGDQRSFAALTAELRACRGEVARRLNRSPFGIDGTNEVNLRTLIMRERDGTPVCTSAVEGDALSIEGNSGAFHALADAIDRFVASREPELAVTETLIIGPLE